MKDADWAFISNTHLFRKSFIDQPHLASQYFCTHWTLRLQCLLWVLSLIMKALQLLTSIQNVWICRQRCYTIYLWCYCAFYGLEDYNTTARNSAGSGFWRNAMISHVVAQWWQVISRARLRKDKGWIAGWMITTVLLSFPLYYIVISTYYCE